jgi:hypothetical protein
MLTPGTMPYQYINKYIANSYTVTAYAELYCGSAARDR